MLTYVYGRPYFEFFPEMTEELEPVISPSLLANIPPPPPDWLCPRQFLFGLGELWEPDYFDPRYETEEVEEMDEFILIASQQYEKSTSVQKTAELQQTPSENGITEIVDVQKSC